MKRNSWGALSASFGSCVLGGVAGAQSELWSVNGAVANEQFAFATTLTGDLDGDGRSDVAVGAPLGAGGLGVVRVLSGATGALLWQATGPAAGCRFGAALASVSDWNGDGRPELVVGAWQANAPGRIGAGLVRVLSGADGAQLYEGFGDSANDHLGWTVARLSDLNGDGMDEFAATAIDDDDGGGSAGSVRVYASVSGATLRTLHGTAPLMLYGSAITMLGDLDGDGVGEYAIGGPFAASATTQAGIVRVHSGTTGAVLRTWSGLAPRDAFGSALSAVGDRDGDSLVDLAVGARQSPTTGGGYVQWISSATAALAPIASVSAPATWRGFGARLAAAGDVDYDGVVDLLIGAPDTASFAGAARLVSGANAAVLFEAQGTLSNERLGAALDAGRDVDGNGSPDFVLGAPGANPSGANSGRARAVSGNDTAPPPPPPTHAPLEADVTELSLASHASQWLELRAGTNYAGMRYRMLGSMHGTDPGFTVDGVFVPLVQDRYLRFVVRRPRLAPYGPARGELDAAGEATVEFDLGPMWCRRWFVGRTFHHSYLVFGADGRAAFASNAVSCTIVP